jgi:hypothetical protein
MTREERERRFQQARKVNARWRHVDGEGRLAVFRATCGNPQCPGHLGDLAFTTKHDVVAHAALFPVLEDLEKGWEVLNEINAEPAASPRGAFRGWHLRPHRSDLKALLAVGDRDSEPTAIYSGFADTGFRIKLRPGKRSRHDTRVGRRDVALNRPRVMHEQREVIGEVVRPGDHVWCPIPSCGTLNYVDWPDSLKDPAAR